MSLLWLRPVVLAEAAYSLPVLVLSLSKSLVASLRLLWSLEVVSLNS